jgi:photosystem II stability/assembly factor-like uncharacterized protein
MEILIKIKQKSYIRRFVMKNIRFAFVLFLIFNFANGQSWKQINSPESKIQKICFKTSLEGWVTGTGFAIYHSTDGGNSWEVQVENISNQLTKIYFSDTLNGWCVGEYGFILNTRNGGKTWEKKNTDINYYLSSVFSLNNTTWVSGYVTTLNEYFDSYLSYGVILRTTNYGDTWEKITDSTIRGIKDIFFIDDKKGWAAGFMELSDIGDPYLIHTIDGGKNWTEQTPSNYGGEYYHIAFADNKIGWVSGWNTPLLKTTDGGTNWSDFCYGGTYRGLVVFDTSEIWAAEGHRIHHTEDGGNTWNVDTLKISGFIVDLSFPNKETGYAVDYDGKIWKYSKEISGIKEKESKIPNNILYPNYPNPANPTTAIKFYVSKESNVKLIIYDILGNEIETLVDEKKNPGFYSIIFNGSKYSSGIYFYRIVTDGWIENKKLILLK